MSFYQIVWFLTLQTVLFTSREWKVCGVDFRSDRIILMVNMCNCQMLGVEEITQVRFFVPIGKFCDLIVVIVTWVSICDKISYTPCSLKHTFACYICTNTCTHACTSVCICTHIDIYQDTCDSE